MPRGSGVSSRLPGVGPVVAQHAAGLARPGARAHGVLAGARAGSDSICAGGHSASSHGEPQRAGPHALGAHGQGRGHLAPDADAARGQHRQRRHRVDDLGPQHHAADLAGVAAALGALGDDEVDAGLLVAQGLVAPCRTARRPGARARGPARSRRRAACPGRWRPACTFSCCSATSTWGAAVAAVQPSSSWCLLVLGQLGHAVVGQELRGEVAVLLRDHAARSSASSFAGVESSPMPSYLPRDHDVDAVGLVADVLVDPLAARSRAARALKPTAPSTPRPPALDTAATTSRQWVKAKIGNSMPSLRQISVCIEGTPWRWFRTR